MKTKEFSSRAESTAAMQIATKPQQQGCCEEACFCAANTTLNQEAFCLNHFLLRCYERLEAIDPRAGRFHDGPVHLAAMRAFIEECSRKTLEIGVHCQNISNFQRSRLLDILLWAGELALLLRAPRKQTLTGFVGLQKLPNFGSGKFIWQLATHSSNNPSWLD